MKWKIEHVNQYYVRALYIDNEKATIDTVHIEKDPESHDIIIAFSFVDTQKAFKALKTFPSRGYLNNIISLVKGESEKLAFDHFIDSAIEEFTDLAEIEGWMRSFIGIPPSYTKTIAQVKHPASTNYDEALSISALPTQGMFAANASTSLIVPSPSFSE